MQIVQIAAFCGYIEINCTLLDKRQTVFTLDPLLSTSVWVAMTTHVCPV